MADYIVEFRIWDYWKDDNDILHVVIDLGGELRFVERQLKRTDK